MTALPTATTNEDYPDLIRRWTEGGGKEEQERLKAWAHDASEYLKAEAEKNRQEPDQPALAILLCFMDQENYQASRALALPISDQTSAPLNYPSRPRITKNAVTIYYGVPLDAYCLLLGIAIGDIIDDNG